MSIFLSLCASIVAPGLSQPNILFISVDDLRPSLGCYEATEVKSPNIDRFAASGVIFDRCYVQVAVCNPSRASMMTGLQPNSLEDKNVYDKHRIIADSLQKRLHQTLPNRPILLDLDPGRGGSFNASP